VFCSEILDGEGRIFPARPPTRGLWSRVRTARLLTVDAIVRTSAEKAELRSRFSADVVDMETSAVASVCESRGVRFLSVRSSATGRRRFARGSRDKLTRSGSYRIGAAVRAIWTDHPP